MNKHEREVLRRKRPILADVLDFSPESQKLYRQMGLLNDDMMKSILDEQTDFSQTSKWLSVVSERRPNSFQLLAELMTERGFSWIADELHADLLAESGDMQLEEYIFREAGMVVHKQFGRSKRIAEVDKKEIQSMIAIRYQAAKEAWRRQLEKQQREREEALKMVQKENSRMKGLAEKIQIFLRVQRPLILKYGHDMETALDGTREDPDPDSTRRDYYTLTEQYVDQTLSILSSTLFQRERREEERKRCLNILDIENHCVELDVILEDALYMATEKLVKTQREATMSDKLVTSLDSRLRVTKKEMEKELMEKERHVLFLESVVRSRDERIRNLEDNLSTLKKKLGEVEFDSENWRRRCELIEKTRRLGYYYPGWYDKMYYNVFGVEYGHKDNNAVTGGVSGYSSKAGRVGKGGKQTSSAKSSPKTLTPNLSPRSNTSSGIMPNQKGKTVIMFKSSVNVD